MTVDTRGNFSVGVESWCSEVWAESHHIWVSRLEIPVCSVHLCIPCTRFEAEYQSLLPPGTLNQFLSYADPIRFGKQGKEQASLILGLPWTPRLQCVLQNHGQCLQLLHAIGNLLPTSRLFEGICTAKLIFPLNPLIIVKIEGTQPVIQLDNHE